MNYKVINVTTFSENCIVIWDKNNIQQAALVDPGGDTELIIKVLSELKLIISQILLTHGHIDHVGAAIELATYYQVQIIGPHFLDAFLLNTLPMQSSLFSLPKCKPLIPDKWLEEGEQIMIGNTIILDVIHCPGHTPGHVVYFDRINRLLISGDVIFNGSIGRTDFPRSSKKDLINSIKNKLLPLGDDITFIPGHGITSTIGYESKNNPFIK
ncbi:MBL fold metallo-hydrolase [Pantoea sp. Aalb]|uniref:MBL fold metallo-hydrolase n=1 Tax=Pantoea sp. Aalb TaxID=2576762 RepID=UPI0013220CD3|nr:MBL fold metallo-hydrolase [Pantoea sp. Aalb]MXP67488.1 MBL fold metallo-hydrolase [Pantoea sp. Aalb]